MVVPFPSRVATWRKHLEPAAYGLLAGLLTLVVAAKFYGSLRLQTLHALHWASPGHFEELTTRRFGPWSAPLDDVFIHFDFARSIARGFPFEWIPGNGYSSGGTSLLYPFVLAIGYLGGFRELLLMEWAAIVACVCTFATLLGARRLAADLPRACAFLIPFGFLSVGALDWSLFSGMEVALLMALWTGAYLVYEEIRAVSGPNARRQQRLLAGVLGLVCALVTATRPEAITSVAVLLVASAYAVVRADDAAGPRRDWRAILRAALPVLVLGAVPSLAVLSAHALANLYFTGETAAAGAIVKLEAHHPYLTPEQVREAWWFHLKYQVLRVTHYHFADQPVYGWIVWILAAVALGDRRARRPALILWASTVLWIALVATNGQVRWQNERYTMPAVAWLLLAASLGAGTLLTWAWERRSSVRGAAIAAVGVGLIALFAVHQQPRFRDQVWFFGRAARNILDQHITAGTRLRFEVDPPPKRVLVGDAGAIPYVSDLPALDIIGLGGFRNLPFARATRHHVAAGIELIERLTPADRPDVLAIYPGWWGELPLWFGTKMGEVPVRGNVICGGASKVLYRANWKPLEGSGVPFTLRSNEQVVDSVDPADLVSERQHRYRLQGSPGYVTMKLLPRPGTQQPLWDGGRIVGAGATETFRLSGLVPGRPARLIVRVAPTEPFAFDVSIDGEPAGTVRVTPNGGWQEVDLPNLTARAQSVEVRFERSSVERTIYHVFLVQER